MTLTLFISDEKEKYNKNKGWDGLFVTEKGELCYKPGLYSNKCYEVNSGKEFEYKGEFIQKGYFKGGLRKLRNTINENIESNPAYGLVSFNRINTSARCLFGSSIKHNNPIQLKICRAERKRDINKDWYNDLNTIVEAELSQSQFAELITSMNVGVGVPCTLKFTEKDGRIPDIEFENKKLQHRQELQENIDGIETQIDDLKAMLKELFSKQRLNKSEKEEVLNRLYKIKGDLTYNSDYMMESFVEQMDKTVTEAKGEIESFMQSRLFNSFKESGSISISEKDIPIEIE